MQLATLVYVKAGGRTLMLHRIKKPDDMHAGKWSGLGGKLEPGETPEECAIREVYEESGLRLVRPRLCGFITFPQFSRGVDWYTFLFVAREFTGTLIDSQEGVLEWIEDDRITQLNLWPGDRIFIPWLEQEQFFSAKFVYVAGELTNHQVVFYTRDTGLDGRHQHDVTILPEPSGFTPVYRSEDDTYCWICGGPVTKRHCKIVCRACGFTRDCSDP